MPSNSWRLHKKKKKVNLRRSSSIKDEAVQTRERAKTLAEFPVKSKSSINVFQPITSQRSYTMGRHFMRRPAVIQPKDIPSIPDSLNVSSNFINVSFENGVSSFIRTTTADKEVSTEHLLHSLFTKQGVEVGDLSRYCITASKGGSKFPVELEASSDSYMAHTIEIRVTSDEDDSGSNPTSPIDKMTVESSLKFFEQNGLVEIPSLSSRDDEETFNLPRVEPLEPIASRWEDLPIDCESKSSLTSSQLSQQQAIWELISTEHSFLRQLEVIINLYMRALELIRRNDLLTEVNYHNIFGYMEEIYLAHEQFWSWTLLPCLDKTLRDHCPLDINDIILRFPAEFSTLFEIYEQHCAFEATNLRSLNEAMNHADFRAYVEWCESNPECHRLKLKDFLAKPMQRLTKYKLLFKAILKKTTEYCNMEDLKQIMEEVSQFVDSVNNVLKAQAETARVEEVMKKISGYNPVEIPGDLKDLIQPHTHLDLMAPMPDVDITKPRILVLQGKLRFRDNKEKMVAHVFLFSDMILVTKAVKDNYTVVRAPYKLSSLQVELRGGTICCIVVSEFRVYSTFFTLKAHSPSIAKEWMDQISSAQDFYNSAITRKVPTWQILESLRQERILHGISQDLIMPEPNDQRLSPFLSGGPKLSRVASNDSTLSSNSSSAFPFEGVSSPREKRRGTLGTLPSQTTPEPSRHRSNSISSYRVNSITSNLLSPPTFFPSQEGGDEVEGNLLLQPKATHSWHRAASLNTLLEKERRLKKCSIQQTLVDVATQTDQSDHFKEDGDNSTCRPNLRRDQRIDSQMIMKDAQVMNDSTDSNSDDEDSSHSPHNSSDAPPRSIIKGHKRSKSNPSNIKFSTTYLINTETGHSQDDEEEMPLPLPPPPSRNLSLSTNGGSERSSLSEQSQEESSVSSSLMSEIIKELSKTDSDISRKFSVFEDDREETVQDDMDMYKSFEKKRQRSQSLYSNFGSLERRFHARRSAVQLTNILESTDEDGDGISYLGNIGKSYFTRNTKLRRSKSSFELSFNRRMKPPSPLTTHMKRSTEKIPDICLHTSSPTLVPSRGFGRFGSFEEESFEEEIGNDNQKDSRGVTNRKKEEVEPVQEKRKNSRARWFSWKNKRVSPTHSKWEFPGLKKNKAMSMESGINNIPAELVSPPPNIIYHDTNPTLPSKSYSTSSVGTISKKANLVPTRTRSLSSGNRILLVIASDNKVM